MYSTSTSPKAMGHSQSRQRGGGGGAVPTGLSPGGGGFGCLLINTSPGRPHSSACGSGFGWVRRGEALHERQRGVSDLPPPVVDGERVPLAGHFDDLGHVLVA